MSAFAASRTADGLSARLGPGARRRQDRGTRSRPRSISAALRRTASSIAELGVELLLRRKPLLLRHRLGRHGVGDIAGAARHGEAQARTTENSARFMATTFLGSRTERATLVPPRGGGLGRRISREARGARKKRAPVRAPRREFCAARGTTPEDLCCGDGDLGITSREGAGAGAPALSAAVLVTGCFSSGRTDATFTGRSPRSDAVLRVAANDLAMPAGVAPHRSRDGPTVHQRVRVPLRGRRL